MWYGLIDKDMHNTKEVNNVFKVINKHPDFKTTTIGRKSTIKITHIPTSTTMTTHHSRSAYHPLRRWLKKFGVLVSILFIFISCEDGYKPTPIDKYKNKDIVVIRIGANDIYDNVKIRCKTKDSIFNILIPSFDARNLKVGDTIK